MTVFSNGQLVLEERIDPSYRPTADDLFQYARVIGIDPINEPNLLHLAYEGLNSPLPANWRPCQDVNGDIYYFDFSTGLSIWDHPCDVYYRHLVASERAQRQSVRRDRADPLRKQQSLECVTFAESQPSTYSRPISNGRHVGVTKHSGTGIGCAPHNFMRNGAAVQLRHQSTSCNDLLAPQSEFHAKSCADPSGLGQFTIDSEFRHPFSSPVRTPEKGNVRTHSLCPQMEITVASEHNALSPSSSTTPSPTASVSSALVGPKHRPGSASPVQFAPKTVCSDESTEDDEIPRYRPSDRQTRNDAGNCFASMPDGLDSRAFPVLSNCDLLTGQTSNSFMRFGSRPRPNRLAPFSKSPAWISQAPQIISRDPRFHSDLGFEKARSSERKLLQKLLDFQNQLASLSHELCETQLKSNSSRASVDEIGRANNDHVTLQGSRDVSLVNNRQSAPKTLAELHELVRTFPRVSHDRSPLEKLRNSAAVSDRALPAHHRSQSHRPCEVVDRRKRCRVFSSEKRSVSNSREAVNLSPHSRAGDTDAPLRESRQALGYLSDSSIYRVREPALPMESARSDDVNGRVRSATTESVLFTDPIADRLSTNEAPSTVHTLLASLNQISTDLNKVIHLCADPNRNLSQLPSAAVAPETDAHRNATAHPSTAELPDVSLSEQRHLIDWDRIFTQPRSLPHSANQHLMQATETNRRIEEHRQWLRHAQARFDRYIAPQTDNR